MVIYYTCNQVTYIIPQTVMKSQATRYCGIQEQYGIGGDRMEREQITIRLQEELLEKLRREMDEAEKHVWYVIHGFEYSFICVVSGLALGLIISMFT